MGYSQPYAARFFGVTRLSIINWEKGKHPIPLAVQILMRLLWEERINGRAHNLGEYVGHADIQIPAPL